ncbi:hypothetical protein PG997_014675 [Apiospora hydei]|uniref:2EXR domain-containing protein n=1 Tax=Apiospora hydei TaxID=1337664 RepID=A0ABR1UUJ2_9PEZI
MTAKRFPKFSRLPKELQCMICVSQWKMAVVEENKDRVLCLHDDTQRIIATPSRLLAPSPVFRTTKDSRYIALMVYSTSLTIVKTDCHALAQDPSMYPCEAVGTLRISWEHDIFLLGFAFRDFRTVYPSGYYEVPVPVGVCDNFASTKIPDSDLEKSRT